MKKRLIQRINFIVIFAILSLLYSCKNETETLPINDHLIYFDSRVVFKDRFYTIYGDTAILETTVTIPNDLVIVECGHCWITHDGNPTISDYKASYGGTNLKKIIITSTVSNYSSLIRYYYRAYIITNNEIIYDLTYVFPNN